MERCGKQSCLGGTSRRNWRPATARCLQSWVILLKNGCKGSSNSRRCLPGMQPAHQLHARRFCFALMIPGLPPNEAFRPPHQVARHVWGGLQVGAPCCCSASCCRAALTGITSEPLWCDSTRWLTVRGRGGSGRAGTTPRELEDAVTPLCFHASTPVISRIKAAALITNHMLCITVNLLC